MQTPFSKIESVPFQGGMVTVREKPLLPFGGYSWIQNIRGQHSGFKKRKGQAVLHDEADGTNKVISLYQFNRTRPAESYFFAQMADGGVLQATNDPPTVATGAVFGTEVYTGTASQWAASWGNIGDRMIYSDCIDQHKIFVGDAGGYVTGFVKCVAGAAHPMIPEIGVDYTDQVTDGNLTTTYATLTGLEVFTSHDCAYICTPVPALALYFDMVTANDSVTDSAMYYMRNTHVWTACPGFVDETDKTATKTLSETDASLAKMKWTTPTSEVPSYMFGKSGFWYQLRTSGATLGTTTISDIKYTAGTSATAGLASFQNIQNVWNGVLPDAVEVYVETAAGTAYETYGAGAVDLDALADGKKIYVVCADPAEAFYIDVGGYPNATGDTLLMIKYCDGSGTFANTGTVGTDIIDGTNAFANSGFITFPRQSAVQPVMFESSRFYAYVYEITMTGALADDTMIAISYIPYFDISDFGPIGNTNCVWKDRAIYSFNLWPEYLYVSEPGNPLFLNGDQYGILEAGDGRSHRVTAMRRFHNELVVYQEEKGTEGGCITMFEGYSPTTFGKILLSSRIGAFNNKCVEVVDGVLTSTATDEKIKTLIFSLSRYGVVVTDGTSVSIISDDIQNYFDPTDTTYCITRGAEDEHWLAYDSAYNGIRIGLATGGTATVNVYLFFDLTDKTWSADVLGQGLACATEVEAGSGDVPIIQVGGGIADGLVYRLNTGTNDVDANHPIASYTQQEFSGAGEYLNLRELVLQTKASVVPDPVVANNAELTISANGIAKITAKDLDMNAENVGEIVRRHRVPMNIMSQHISVKINHDTASKEMYLESLGLSFAKWVGR